MANDSFDINITGAGAAKSAGVDTSNIQRAIDQVSNDLKRLDTSSFQKSLRDLAQNIQKAAISASNFVANMQKTEARISSSLKEGLSSQSPTRNSAQNTFESKDVGKKSTIGGDAVSSDKFIKSISSLSDSIDKLAAGIKGGFKSKEEAPEEKKEKKDEDLVGGVKKLLAAVGIGSILRSVTENEIIAPTRATGMLINSNVISSPRQAGNDLLSSFQNRVANTTGTLTGAAGAGVGAAIGSIVPGIGTLIGAGLGYAGGSAFGGSVGEQKKALELPTLQRALTLDSYSSQSRQISQYGQFAQAQYGQKGFSSTEAFQDPYFESKAELGKSFSRFAGGNLSSQTTSNILKSLTAQGATSPQELNTTGNLLGQIARYTGKSSFDIEKVYKAVEKTGINPNEGLQKALSLLQSGLSVKETEAIIGKSAQRSEAFNAAQSSYFGSSPFQQFQAQMVGKVVGIDVEKLEKGDKGEAAKFNKIVSDSNEELRSGKLGKASIQLQQLMSAGIGRELADTGKIDLKAKGKEDQGFLSLSKTQEKTVQMTQEAINRGAKGRGPEEIIDKALDEIGKSTESFTGLKEAAKSLSDSFVDITKSIDGYMTKLSQTDIHGNAVKPPITKAVGGR